MRHKTRHKIRAPKWVQAFLEDCPNIIKNSSYYRALSQPTVPPASIFINGLASLQDDQERTKVAEKHIVKRIEFLTQKYAVEDRDRKEAQMLIKVISTYNNVKMTFSDSIEITEVEELDLSQPLWEDDGLLTMDSYDMRKAISAWSLMDRMTMPDNLRAMNRQMDLLIEKINGMKTDKDVIKNGDYDLSGWLKPVNRNRFYEINRVGFNSNFEPTNHSLNLYTTIILQSLQELIKSVPTTMRTPEVATHLRRADWSGIIKYPELNEYSSEFWLMKEYIKAGGLRRVTVNLGMQPMSSNLGDRMNPPAKASLEEWRNLLLYRLMGQVKPPKITVDSLIGLSLAYQTPIHQILLHQYDLAALLGRRTLYLPNLDRIHAYLEVVKPELGGVMESYLSEYMFVYMQNIQRIPNTRKKMDKQFRVLMQKGQLQGCNSVMAVIREIVMGNPDTQHLIQELDNKEAEKLNPVYDVSQLYREDDLEENYDDLEDLEDDDEEEDENQIQRIQKLLGSDLGTLKPEPQPEPVVEDPNAIPHQPKPQWDWD